VSTTTTEAAVPTTSGAAVQRGTPEATVPTGTPEATGLGLPCFFSAFAFAFVSFYLPLPYLGLPLGLAVFF